VESSSDALLLYLPEKSHHKLAQNQVSTLYKFFTERRKNMYMHIPWKGTFPWLCLVVCSLKARTTQPRDQQKGQCKMGVKACACDVVARMKLYIKKSRAG
jgi:hypothetical protein